MTSGERMNYVIDTNIAIDYVDVIPNGVQITLDHPKIDLSDSNLIIPTVVVRELDGFKRESNDRGLSARQALNRIRAITEAAHLSIEDVYALRAPITVPTSDYTVTILPVHQHFCNALPFKPSERDMDGQIILTAMSALYSANGQPIDGSPVKFDQIDPTKLTLLTNDNGMAIRANARGILTARFGYTPPPPYTGRREVAIPDELFRDFYEYGEMPLKDWTEAMPKESPLIANEFLIMRPQSGEYPEDFDRMSFRHVGRYDKESETIVALKYFRNFPGYPQSVSNEGQAIYAEALTTHSIACIICTGPAGSGKTYMAAVYGLAACRKGTYIGITTVPCDVEDDKLGALPGDLNEKMDPSVQTIKNALKNSILQENKWDKSSDKKSIKKQILDQVEACWDSWFENIPIYYARGRDFTKEFAIFDEFQDQNRTQADTLLKRLGREGKIILTGDIEQVHSIYLDHDNNGIVYARRLIMDDPMVAQVAFTEEEVVRHPLVKMIAQRQREAKLHSGSLF